MKQNQKIKKIKIIKKKNIKSKYLFFISKYVSKKICLKFYVFANENFNMYNHFKMNILASVTYYKIFLNNELYSRDFGSLCTPNVKDLPLFLIVK